MESASSPISATRNPEQAENLLLNVGQLRIKGLHYLIVLEQKVPLGQSKEPEDLFRAGPFFWVDWQHLDAYSLHGASDFALNERL